MLGLWPFSKRPIASLDTSIAPPGAEVTRYFSDRGLTTGETDSPADTHFEARLVQPLVWRRSIVGERLGGRGSFRAGEIELRNLDGALNAMLADEAVDGRDVTVRVGLAGWSHGQFLTLFGGTASGWRHGPRGAVLVQPRGVEFKLDIPVQSSRYAGTGAEEGGDDLKGKPKPWPVGGPLQNAPAPLLNTDLVYQLRDGGVISVEGVFDRGVAIPLDTAVGSGGDVADYAALVGLSIAAGKYATDLSGGYARLASSPAGQVTFDFTATNETKPGEVLKLIATEAGIAAEDLDDDSFTQLDADVAYPIQRWIGPEEITAAALFDEIVASVEGWWGDNRLGGLQVGQVKAPSGGAQANLEMSDLLEFEWLTLPPGVNPAIKGAFVGYEKIWFVQETDLDGAIADARRRLIVEEFRFADQLDPAIAAIHLRAQTVVVKALFATQAGAEDHASHLLDLYTKGRRLARMVIGHKGYRLDLGQQVRVTAERFGLANRRFRIAGLNVDAGRHRVEIVGFL